VRIAFCAYGITEETLRRTEFYHQDFQILSSLGHEVTFLRKFTQLDSSFDVAFVWWWNYLWAWGPKALVAGVPIITTGVFDLGRHASLPIYKRFLKRWGARFSSKNVFVSLDEHERVPKALGLKPELVDYSPLVVDTSIYHPLEQVPRSEGTITIANVCWQRLTNIHRKMVKELLEAFALLARENDRVRLVLAGPPEDGREVLVRLAGDLGVSDKVNFPGELSRDDKIALMRKADLYCQVSRYEGFGVAIAEAMACGSPVLVSDVGAVSEVVGDCGTYVRDLSVKGIFEGLKACLSDIEACRRKAVLGAERIAKLFSVERRRKDLKKALEEVTSQRDRKIPAT